MLSFFVDTTVCGFSLYQVFAYFLIYSCLGWCLEVIYAAVTTGKLINRGFLNGPVCPIYGFGMVIVLFVLTPLSHSLLVLYLGGVLLPSALELVGGWALYKLYHTRWWDYSDYPFNIGGYICLEFSLLWGVGTLIVMKLVHPIIANAVALIPPLVGLILRFLLYAIYAADTIATAFAASDLARDLDALEKVADSMHAVSDAMTELLGTNATGITAKMTNEKLSTTDFQVVYEDDPTLAPGTEKVKTTPYTGSKWKTYRNLYDANGKLISSTYEDTSDYKARNKVILKGPAKAEVPASGPADIPAPTPEAPDTPAVPETPVEPPTETPTEPEEPTIIVIPISPEEFPEG